MNTNPTHATHESTLSPAMSSILAVVLLILIVFLLINRSRKKKGKEPIRISSLLREKAGALRPGTVPAGMVIIRN
jgi:hypothetical protein